MGILSKINSVNARFYPKHLFYAPSWIVLGVNNVCNLHCKMCDIGTQNLDSNFAVNLAGTKPLNMPIELTMRIIDEAAKYYPKTKIGYAFTEPLVYPHLISTLIYANEKKLYTSLTTNALTLPRKAKALAKSGLNEIYISLDGLEKTHNEIRGNQKSFQKAIEGINALKTFSKRPKINVVFAITQWNYDQLFDFANYFKTLGIDQLGFMHMVFTTTKDAEKHNEIWGSKYPATDSNMDFTDFTKIDTTILAKQISRIKKTDFPFGIFFSPEIKNENKLYTYYNHSDIFFGKRCNDIFQNIMIKSNGDVIPAHGRCYNLTIGNMYDNNLKEIWNSEIIRKFRTSVHQAGGLLPACSRCCSGFGK